MSGIPVTRRCIFVDVGYSFVRLVMVLYTHINTLAVDLPYINGMKLSPEGPNKTPVSIVDM